MNYLVKSLLQFVLKKNDSLTSITNNTEIGADIFDRRARIVDVDIAGRPSQVQVWYQSSFWMAEFSSPMFVVKEGDEVRVINRRGNLLIVEDDSAYFFSGNA